MKILAVDDDPIILELLCQFIATLSGHSVITAESGREALDLLKQPDTAEVDCFLLDIQMPGMDGVALARKIRETVRYADTPILMLTAMSDKRYIDAAFAAGATDYVTKPFEPTELKARISLVEGLVTARQSRTRKIFAAKSLQQQVTPIDRAVELHEPISIFDVDNVIDFTAMENYVRQLDRGSLFGSTSFAFSIREIEEMHGRLTAFEFYSLVSDVAEVISDTLADHQFLMAYSGNGTFVCVTESGWRPDMTRLMDGINLALAQTELYDNRGQRLHPRVCAGEAVRLIWKSGQSIMDAVAQAHASAEQACIDFKTAQNDFWYLGRSA
jgi:CheY-like chemotaxis protein